MTKARTQDERETTITYDSGERVVRIYSSRPADQARLRRAKVEPYDGSPLQGFRYKVPLNRLSWRIKGIPTGPKRILSENHPFLRANRTKNGTPEQA